MKNEDWNKSVGYKDISSYAFRSGYRESEKTDFLSTALPYSRLAQNENNPYGIRRGFYLGAVYSALKDPTFNPISEEVVVQQTAYAPGFLGGYFFNTRYFGLGIRASFWHTSLNDFIYDGFADDFVTLTNPEFTHLSFDFILEGIPFKKSFLGLYGLLEFASSTESYLISGSNWDSNNGSKKNTTFDYGYGLGIRISPLKWISVISELRWIPGVRTTPMELVYSKNGIGYYAASGDSYTKNYTRIISAGLMIHLSVFKDLIESQK